MEKVYKSLKNQVNVKSTKKAMNLKKLSEGENKKIQESKEPIKILNVVDNIIVSDYTVDFLLCNPNKNITITLEEPIKNENIYIKNCSEYDVLILSSLLIDDVEYIELKPFNAVSIFFSSEIKKWLLY